MLARLFLNQFTYPLIGIIKMNKLIVIVLSLSTLFSITACQTAQILPDGVTPVQATWLYGRYIIPSTFTKTGSVQTIQQTLGQSDWTLSASQVIKPNSKVPITLYLHGCKGIHQQAKIYSQLLISEGYAVFMPDSFQRPGREQCRAQGTLTERVALRTQEVAYALKQIRKLTWVDQKRVLLMGFSEGGNTADSWSRPGFAGVMIMSSACTLVGGIPATPADTPVLAVVGANDDYRPGLSCNINRNDGVSRSIVIPGAGHKIAHYQETKQAIRTFLRSFLTKRL